MWKLKLFCFPFLCWGGIIIFIVWSVGKLKLLCFPFLCWGGIIICIVWSVGKLKLFCFPFLCWGGILIFIMDHPPGHTFYDMQGKWCLLSPVSSTGDPFRCRSIYSAPFGERMLWTQQRWWWWNHDTIEHMVWWYTDQLNTYTNCHIFCQSWTDLFKFLSVINDGHV